MRVLVIGLKRELPLSPADALDIADRLVARAASAHTDGNSMAQIGGVLIRLEGFQFEGFRLDSQCSMN